jgi:1-acyl-sn-glycerol-3-phosphate acyltransferase
MFLQKVNRKMKKFEKWSLGYACLRAYTTLIHRCFYKFVHVSGRENVPSGQPLIFSPNHQNALMDALAVLTTVNQQPVFLARADMFKKKAVIAILHFLKILPVYRMRDGMENLGENEEIFSQVVKVLDNKKSVCILPEGNHGDRKRLRTLKKGIFRVAFIAQREHADKPWVKIIPVGLDYSNYSNFQAELLVNYRKPIEVSDYWNLYTENPVKAINQLREDLVNRMKEGMIHIENEEFYSTYISLLSIFKEELATWAGLNPENPYHRFRAAKEFVTGLDSILIEDLSFMQSLKNKVDQYTQVVELHGMRDGTVKNEPYSLFGLLFNGLMFILFLPVFVFGAINNYLPYKLPVILGRSIKDPQFISSARFGLSLVTFFVFYPIMVFLFSLVSPGISYTLAYLFLLPLSGWFAFLYYTGWKKMKSKWHFFFLQHRKPGEFETLIRLRKGIVDDVQYVIKKMRKE